MASAGSGSGPEYKLKAPQGNENVLEKAAAPLATRE
jgi:hypothetical protein